MNKIKIGDKVKTKMRENDSVQLSGIVKKVNKYLVLVTLDDGRTIPFTKEEIEIE